MIEEGGPNAMEPCRRTAAAAFPQTAIANNMHVTLKPWARAISNLGTEARIPHCIVVAGAAEWSAPVPAVRCSGNSGVRCW